MFELVKKLGVQTPIGTHLRLLVYRIARIMRFNVKGRSAISTALSLFASSKALSVAVSALPLSFLCGGNKEDRPMKIRILTHVGNLFVGISPLFTIHMRAECGLLRKPYLA